MGSLSISKAWDETKDILARDGRLFAIVALAFLILPLAILGAFVPGGLEAATMSAFESNSVTLMLLVVGILIVILVGQLAITRLAIGPSMTVGAAISHAARRLPSYVLMGVIVGALMLILMLVGAILVAATVGSPVSQEELARSPAVVIMVLVMFVVYLSILARVISMAAAVAIAEAAGPLRIIRRSLSLTSGHFWRLFAFVVVFLIGTGIAVFAISTAVGAALQVSVGPVESMSASALILSLVEAAANGVVLLLFSLMLARIYVQLAGISGGQVSVPSSGT